MKQMGDRVLFKRIFEGQIGAGVLTGADREMTTPIEVKLVCPLIAAGLEASRASAEEVTAAAILPGKEPTNQVQGGHRQQFHARSHLRCKVSQPNHGNVM